MVAAWLRSPQAKGADEVVDPGGVSQAADVGEDVLGRSGQDEIEAERAVEVATEGRTGAGWRDPVRAPEARQVLVIAAPGLSGAVDSLVPAGREIDVPGRANDRVGNAWIPVHLRCGDEVAKTRGLRFDRDAAARNTAEDGAESRTVKWCSALW